MKTLFWDAMTKTPVNSNPILTSKGNSPQISHDTGVLQLFRKACISEMSVCVFKESNGFRNKVPLSKDRQTVVEELVKKFLALEDDEKLLFFLMIPSSENSMVQLAALKANILGPRIEVRQTAAWIKSHLQEDRQVSIPKRDVYDQYLKHCETSNLKPISTADFGKVMKQVYPNVRPRRLGTRGNSQYCYAGMRSSLHVKRPDLYSNENGAQDCNPGCQAVHTDCAESHNSGELFTMVKQEGVLDIPQETFTQFKPDSTLLIPNFSGNETSSFPCNRSQGPVVNCKTKGCTHSETSLKCRNRKTIFNHKLKKYIPIQPKPVKCSNESIKETINPMDWQVEEELAQYFKTTNDGFALPHKLKTRKSAENTKPSLFRSQSCSGVKFGSNNDNSDAFRSQSTMECYQPELKANHQHHHPGCGSSNDAHTFNPNDPSNYPQLQMLLQRPVSAYLSNFTPSSEQNTPSRSGRFTPIPNKQGECLSQSVHSNKFFFRPPEQSSSQTSSCSSIGLKWGMKRSFAGAFLKQELAQTPPSVTFPLGGWQVETGLQNIRSQSLPQLIDLVGNNQENASDNINSLFVDPITDFTNEELSRVLEDPEKNDPHGFDVEIKPVGLTEYFGNINPSEELLPTLNSILPVDKEKESAMGYPAGHLDDESDILSEMFSLLPNSSLREEESNESMICDDVLL